MFHPCFAKDTRNLRGSTQVVGRKPITDQAGDAYIRIRLYLVNSRVLRKFEPSARVHSPMYFAKKILGQRNRFVKHSPLLVFHETPGC